MAERLIAWWLNGVASSALWSPRTRSQLMRWVGIDVRGTLWPGATIVGTRLTIESGAFVNVNVTFAAGAEIHVESNVAIGQGAILTTGSHVLGPSSQRAGRLVSAPIRIKRGSWLGAGTIVHPGVTIGEGCVVASGSVVLEDLEPHGLYAGAPATRRRDLDPE